jgi:general L-amino acid transport system permease protein
VTTTTQTEVIRPPESPGFWKWIRENLFSNWINGLLTIISMLLIYWVVTVSVRWVFFTADWSPVITNPLLYLVGQYPREELWRLGASLAMISLLLGVSWRKWGGVMRTFAYMYGVFLLIGTFWPAQGETLTMPMRAFFLANILVTLAGYWLARVVAIRPAFILGAWTASAIVTLFLLSGVKGVNLLPKVPTGLWGGLLVTMILAIGGITLSFPIGVLLALGRRSSLPVLSVISTVLIEVVRGVPLIGILTLFSIILPLFLPPEVRIDRLLRALVGMTIFSAAYMAENVRGGLAAVPDGQIEAAKALGLKGYQITTQIVLPQALRAVIPPIVGQFISLFKDTTLAAGIAVLELLSVGRSILQANPEYIGLQTEVYIFIAAVFWIFSYLMSYASRRLEVALGVGER